MKHILTLIAILLIIGCGDPTPCGIVEMPVVDCSVMAVDAGWAKVNTHSHTILSDGRCSPAKVIQWYKDSCYDALAITDHDMLYNGTDADMVIIPGMEESTGPHYTLLNDGEIRVLNHPGFKFDYTLDTVADLMDTDIFEVYNYCASVHGRTGGEEAIWNAVLESGKMLYGVAADDAHFKNFRDYGFAFIVARVNEVTQASILNAIAAGDFYASTGVYLSEYSIEGDYTMTVDHVRTDASECSFALIQAGNFQRGKVTCIRPDGAAISAWGQPVKLR